MAKLVSNIKFTGTIENLCYYKMQGEYYVRRESSLTAETIKTSPRFLLTRVYAALMAQASKIASSIYKELPKDFRQFWMYRAFTGEALQLLKKGTSAEETQRILWKTYVEVWEQKKSMQQSAIKTKLKKKPCVQIKKAKPPTLNSIFIPYPSPVYSTRRLNFQFDTT